MAERYVREVTRDDTHLADVKGTPGAHRGLEYDDDNNLVAHAEYYPVDEEDLYEELRKSTGKAPTTMSLSSTRKGFKRSSKSEWW